MLYPMKFVIYKDQRKYTLDNVDLSDQDELDYLKELPQQLVVNITDVDLCKFRITSSKSLIENVEYIGDELDTHRFDDIDWRQETVN